MQPQAQTKRERDLEGKISEDPVDRSASSRVPCFMLEWCLPVARPRAYRTALVNDVPT